MVEGNTNDNVDKNVGHNNVEYNVAIYTGRSVVATGAHLKGGRSFRRQNATGFKVSISSIRLLGVHNLKKKIFVDEKNETFHSF